ncbi:hypothetical protein MPSEU_000310000 [Mayamaea pseudoterrestris]|nr:hypothetical protein MPSEU_000310000 [Mayamaea pseudoterrestris]
MYSTRQPAPISTTRRESSGSRYGSNNGPLSNTSTSSRRHQLALFRHASTKRASAKSMSKTRQHAKQLASMQQQANNADNQQQETVAVDFFADFSAAFPDADATPSMDLFAAAPQQHSSASASFSNGNSSNALLRRRLSKSNNHHKLLHTNDSFASDDYNVNEYSNNNYHHAAATANIDTSFFDENPFAAQQRDLEEEERQKRALSQQAQMMAQAAAKVQERQRRAAAAANANAAVQQQQDDLFQPDWSSQHEATTQRIPAAAASSSPSNKNQNQRTAASFFADQEQKVQQSPAASRSHSQIGSGNAAATYNHSPVSAGSSSYNNNQHNVVLSGGAAARRRVRSQMKKSGNGGGGSSVGESDATNYSHSPASSSKHLQSPPQSPLMLNSPALKSAQQQQQQQRWQLQQQQYNNHQHSDASSIGASSTGSRSQYLPHPRSVTGSTRSITSSTASSSGQNDIFDTKHPDGGFRFDAFGLDESQINYEVTQAMQEIAHQNPNISFFMDNDDFANSNVWDNVSPNQSRASTPTKDEQDGFVDGFRVNKLGGLRQSPTSTERTSLTSDSSGRVNLFKLKAGFHESKPARRVVAAPSTDRRQSLSTRQPQQQQQQQQQDGMQLEMPRLQEPIMRRTKSQDVDFFDPGFESSDAEGFESDVGGTNTSTTADPTEIPSSTDGSVRRHEEKKDDDAGETSKRRPTMEALKSKWSLHSGSAMRMQPNGRPSPRQQQSAASPQLTQPMVSTRQFDAPAASMKEGNYGKRQLEMKNSVQEAVIRPAPSYERREGHQSISSGRSSPVSTHGDSPQHANQYQQQVGGETPNLDEQSNQRQAPYDNAKLDVAPSFESFRDRLRPVGSQDDKFVKAKSEGGAAINMSAVNAVLRRIEIVSPNDSKSDTGVPSPAFAQVKLRRTMIAKMEDTKQEAALAEPKLPTHEPEQQELRQVDEPVQPERKMTYREKRELELQQQREEEERRKADEAALSQNDVASQIRRRVASVAQQNAILPKIPTSHVSGTSLYQNLRSSRPDNEAELMQGDSSTVSRQHAKSIPTFTTPPPSSREPADLVIQPSMSGDFDPSPSKEADAVVSRLLNLKQAEKTAAKQVVPPIDTGEQVYNEKGPNQLHTPKATMMMLNAFLAGREAITSHETGSKTEQPTMIDVGEDDSPESQARVAAGSPTQYPSDLPTLKDDPKYAKYFKMLSMGMPLEVVKHAMTRDGFNPAVMDQDHNKPVGIPLNRDPKYSKYFKMLGIGLPMDAVKHAMERDGLNSSVMDRDHSLPAEAVSSDDLEEPKEKDSHRRARLHWKTLRQVTSNSLWAKIDQDDQLEKILIDEAEFQELFQVVKDEEANTATTTRPKISAKRGVCVIDPKRANNGGIILARLKMSHDEMADAVDRINENALTAEQIEHIIEYLPSKEERKALEAYMLEGGQDAAEKFDRLCECEKFMVSMMTVKHAKRKVRALLFKLQFRTCLEDIYNDTVIVESACDELNNSVRLRQLFGIILTFGNRLNTVGSGKQRRAGAFTLDSLLKLKQAKAFDKKTTFLHYVVLIVRRNNEILLRFKDDLPSVFRADKIFWDQCVNDLEEVENQLENVRKISLHQARQSHTYRLRRKKRDDDAESLSDGEMDLSLEEEVELLRSTPIGMFTLSAIKYVSSLRDKVEVTKTKFARLLEYFGDEDKKLQPHELFSIIGTFSRDFEKANEEVVANEKKKQREERKRQAVSKAGPGRPPTYSPGQKPGSNPLLKASNPEPTMFHVLTEMKAKVAAKEAVPMHPVHPQQLRRIEESPPNGSAGGHERYSSQPIQRPAGHDEQRSPQPVQRQANSSSSSSNAVVNTPEKSSVSGSRRDLPGSTEIQKTPSPIKVAQISPSKTPISRTPSTQEDVKTIPEPKQAPHASPPTATPRAHNILREKAKLRRQRYIQDRSPPPPAATAQEQNIATPPLVRNRSPEANDDGAQPLSPRSSMRLRMEQRVHRNRFSAAGAH